MQDTARKSLLSISDLAVTIDGRVLCKSLSVEMSRGQSWSILGPNGSGKTSLLHTIAGLLSPSHGEIHIAGDKISCLSSRQLALRRSILFQKSNDAFPATVMETILSGRHPHIPYWQTETETDYEIARRALANVDLASFEERDINRLSGGERQRVSIAASLVQETPIRLFDEPANHLDLKHQNTILKLISESDQHLNLLVLQDINHAWRYTTHALLVYPDGRTETGTTEEILTVDKLGELYGCELRMIQDGKNRLYFQH